MFVRITRSLIESNKRTSFTFVRLFQSNFYPLKTNIRSFLSFHRNPTNIFFDLIVPKRKIRSVTIDVDQTAARVVYRREKRFGNKNSCGIRFVEQSW